MYWSPIRVTEVPGDVFGWVCGLIVFGVAVPVYDVASCRLCLEVSDDMIDDVRATCVGVLVCSSFLVVVLIVFLFVIFFRHFVRVCSEAHPNYIDRVLS